MTDDLTKMIASIQPMGPREGLGGSTAPEPRHWSDDLPDTERAQALRDVRHQATLATERAMAELPRVMSVLLGTSRASGTRQFFIHAEPTRHHAGEPGQLDVMVAAYEPPDVSSREYQLLDSCCLVPHLDQHVADAAMAMIEVKHAGTAEREDAGGNVTFGWYERQAQKVAAEYVPKPPPDTRGWVRVPCTNASFAAALPTDPERDALAAALAERGVEVRAEADADELRQVLLHDAFDVRTHNGKITIHNRATDRHRTFRIRLEFWGKANGDGNPPDEKRVVALLVGPNRDDPKCWKSFGFATDTGVRVWRKHQARNNGGQRTDYEAFAKLLNYPAQAMRDLDVAYMYEGSCCRCNRSLTVPASIIAGIGPVCAEKAQGGDQ